MFTGIIQAVGKIKQVTRLAHDLSLVISTGDLPLEGVNLGDSIAVNGVCLTVVKLGASEFSADVSVESLEHTNIGRFNVGTPVNLEKALTLATPLGGHLVSGHVDGVGTVVEMGRDGRSIRYRIETPASIQRYIAAKGSITVDGVSLTVTDLAPDGLYLNIVPHTAENTIIPHYQAGTRVHLEVDLIARYTERLLQCSESEVGRESEKLDRDFLFANGFTGRRK